MVHNDTVGVIIPTLNAASELAALLQAVKISHCHPEILIIDSSSSDATLEIARAHSARTMSIPRHEFNHGLTRELGRQNLHTDIVVLLSQDVVPVTEFFIDELIRPITSGTASISYARQIPRKHASFIEAFPRQYNYPAEPNTRTIADAGIHGVYTFFCSDSCAAYRNAALDEINGFPETIVAEDYLAAAQLLARGHTIAYAAGCVVEHSHNYTILKEFRRSFDTGVYRKRNAWIERYAGRADKRGIDFVKSFVHEAIAVKRPDLVPYILAQSAAKFVGYLLGYRVGHLESRIFRHFSMHPHYWEKKRVHNTFSSAR